eukprot:SAG22_NODE_686_length_7917_cov_3.094270_1_plen_220_part_10
MAGAGSGGAKGVAVQQWLDGSVDNSQLLHQSLDSVGGPLRIDSGGLAETAGGKPAPGDFWQQAIPLGSSITPGGKAADAAAAAAARPQGAAAGSFKPPAAATTAAATAAPAGPARPVAGAGFAADAFSPLYNSQHPPPPPLTDDSPPRRKKTPTPPRPGSGGSGSSGGGSGSERKSRKWRDAAGQNLTIAVPRVQSGPHSPEAKPLAGAGEAAAAAAAAA